ncbi:MAG TPA: GTP-binding protein, partial [Pseudoxanthomonas sp.]|nr:GTP-binding protein [Pseudoxanthomonas sp.]
MLSAIEDGVFSDSELSALRKQWASGSSDSRFPIPHSRLPTTPVIGITGTGGAGKSSVTDELLNRFLASFPAMRMAVISVDPTRRRTGGALLGDRIRMNSLRSERIYMRSMATRRQNVATNAVLKDCIAFLKSIGFDLVIVETAGIGQSDSEIVDLVDFPMYVMTSDYGAASQLEKIDMLDFAELVVLNKYDKRGAEDALRDVRKQWKRNRVAFQMKDEDVPVYPTIASQFNDPGISWMFANLCRLLREKLGTGNGEQGVNQPGSVRCDFNPDVDTELKEPRATVLIPGARVRYLAEIAEQGRGINRRIETEAETASRAQSYWQSLRDLEDPALPKALDLYPVESLLPSGDGARRACPVLDTGADEGVDFQGAKDIPQAGHSISSSGASHHLLPQGEGKAALLLEGEGKTVTDRTLLTLRQRYNDAVQSLSSEALKLLREWPQRLKAVTDEINEYQVRGKTIRIDNYRESLSHQK